MCVRVTMPTQPIRPYQRYRVTLLRDLWERAEADAQRRAPGRWVLVVPRGTVVEGVASDVAADGFFDLNLDDKTALRLNANDRWIRIEPLP